MARLIADKFAEWQKECDERFNTLNAAASRTNSGRR